MRNIRIAGMAMADQEKSRQLAEFMPARHLCRMPAYVRAGLCAALFALRDAGLFPAPAAAGIIIGTSFGCQKTAFDFMDSILADGPALASPLAFSHSVNNIAAAQIAIALNLQGPAFTLNCQEQNPAALFQTAEAMLANDRCPWLLAGLLEERDERMARVFPQDRTMPAAFFMVLGKC